MTTAVRPLCPGCGEPVGAYEPLTRVRPGSAVAEPTFWLALDAGRPAQGEVLWHASCANDARLGGR
jgi:hypothetical protein